MRVVIELDDATLRHAVETQIDKAVADLATAHITKKVDEILSKKFERLDGARIDEIAGIAAAKFLRGASSDSYRLEAKVNAALAGAARELVREKSKTI